MHALLCFSEFACHVPPRPATAPNLSQAAVELGRVLPWELPAPFHLRLLAALVNDAINCFQMKTEINAR
jgi:hypothetical protein